MYIMTVYALSYEMVTLVDKRTQLGKELMCRWSSRKKHEIQAILFSFCMYDNYEGIPFTDSISALRLSQDMNLCCASASTSSL